MSRVKKLSRFFGETFRNWGVGISVGSIILTVSRTISEETVYILFFAGVASILFGAILYLYGE